VKTVSINRAASNECRQLLEDMLAQVDDLSAITILYTAKKDKTMRLAYSFQGTEEIAVAVQILNYECQYRIQEGMELLDDG